MPPEQLEKRTWKKAVEAQKRLKIAVLIPCYNEEKTIRKVVQDFRVQLPDADLYVYDNNSVDGTVAEAKAAGAIVGFERRQGKGYVIRTMFRNIDADVYVMVDGDCTYPADKVQELIRPVIEDGADMVVGSRLHPEANSKFRLLNRIGNYFFLRFLNSVFRGQVTDLLSGFRAFSRRFVKSIPVLSRGFEIETEMTVRAIECGYLIREIPINLSARPEGSSSKIKVVSDGFLILKTIVTLFRDYKPLMAFGLVGLVGILLGFVPGTVVIVEFIQTQYITHVPLAILSVGLVLSGLIVAFVGLILESISQRFRGLDYLIQNMISNHQHDTHDAHPLS